MDLVIHLTGNVANIGKLKALSSQTKDKHLGRQFDSRLDSDALTLEHGYTNANIADRTKLESHHPEKKFFFSLSSLGIFLHKNNRDGEKDSKN